MPTELAAPRQSDFKENQPREGCRHMSPQIPGLRRQASDPAAREGHPHGAAPGLTIWKGGVSWDKWWETLEGSTFTIVKGRVHQINSRSKMRRQGDCNWVYIFNYGTLSSFLFLSLNFQNLSREAHPSQMENLSVPLWKIWRTSKKHAMETDTGKISTDSSAQTMGHPLGNSAVLPPTSRPLNGPSPPQAHRASGPILKYQHNQGSWDIRGSTQHRKRETHKNTQKNKTKRKQRPWKQRRNGQEIRASTLALPELTKNCQEAIRGEAFVCVLVHRCVMLCACACFFKRKCIWPLL